MPDKYPFLSRSPEWTKDAVKQAEGAYEQAKAKSLEERGRDLNDAEKQELLLAAFEVAEEDRAKQAALYAPRTPAPAAAKKPTPRTVDNSMRAAVTKVNPSRKGATLEELKRERRTRS